MSNYEKLIKQATKPKPGAPKSKYIDPIIASSFSQDGSLQEVCRAFASRLSDSSSLVVFRTLIVMHTLIRNGGVDNVMNHLASNQSSLKLKNVVAGGNWQGYDAPRMLSQYAAYIEERIKAYRELRRDPIRSSGGTNSREGSGSGQRLRKLTVDKGLLREVSIAQKVCSRLLDMFFSYFTDNTQDELSITAFRMSLKDMLAIYAAINEGVINILEHYFEMAKSDAERALEIYKRFCAHTEKIVAYLSSAKKISHSLNVPIPTLRHAPVSLAGALQEYLNDPNFEKNRAEYKENKRIADSGGSSSTTVGKPIDAKKEEAKKSIIIKEPTAEEKTRPVKPPTSNQALQDFFESIETEQMSMFAGAPQQQQQFASGMPQLMAQPTGYNPFMNGGNNFMMPQQTGFMPQQQNAFFAPQQQQSGFLQPQQTGFMQPQMTGFLQPQMTGFNPFRQSVMMQQPTGMNGFQNANWMGSSPSFAPPSGGEGSGMNSSSPSNNTVSALASSSQQPARSASAPIKALSAQKTGSRNPFAPPPGERVPTPPPVGPKGPSLRELAMGGVGSSQGPTSGGGGKYGLGADAWGGSGGSQQQQSQQSMPSSGQLVPQKTGLIGSIASEFVKGSSNSDQSNGSALFPSSAQSPAPTNSSTNDFNSSFASLSMQPNSTSQPQQPLQSQPTGFGGSTVKPFQPSSSFGASLLNPPPATLPPSMTGNPFANMGSASSSTPGSQSAQPAASTSTSFNNGLGSSLIGSTGLSNGGLSTASPASGETGQTSNGNVGAQPTGFGSSLFGSSAAPSLSSNIASQPTGFGSSPFGSTSSPSAGFSAQPTGLGSSFFSSAAQGSNGVGGQTGQQLTAQPTGFGGSTVKPFQPSSAFGTSAFGGAGQQQQQSQQQQQQRAVTGSLF